MRIITHDRPGVCAVARAWADGKGVRVGGWMPAQYEGVLSPFRSHPSDGFLECVKRNVSGSHVTLVIQKGSRDHTDWYTLAFNQAQGKRFAFDVLQYEERFFDDSMKQCVMDIHKRRLMPMSGGIINVVGSESNAHDSYVYLILDKIYRRLGDLGYE